MTQNRIHGYGSNGFGKGVGALSGCESHCYCTLIRNTGKIDELRAVADKHGAVIIEDAVESLGATYKKKQTGTFDDYSAISFNGNNIGTTKLCQYAGNIIRKVLF